MRHDRCAIRLRLSSRATDRSANKPRLLQLIAYQMLLRRYWFGVSPYLVLTSDRATPNTPAVVDAFSAASDFSPLSSCPSPTFTGCEDDEPAPATPLGPTPTSGTPVSPVVAPLDICSPC